MPVTVKSFAKINLGLRIGTARDDGFHELLTVYQTIGLHDDVRVSVGRGTGIEIRCADPRVPRDESNTCFRIVEKALGFLKVKSRVVVEIEKRLPVQGGLGGASANAVAALLGLERALKKSLASAERLRIAAEVGSDLPLFLVGGTVLGVGRGEQVYPLQDLPAMACVVVTPEVGVSTPKAFAEWDRLYGQYKRLLPELRQVLTEAREWTQVHFPGESGTAARKLLDEERKLTALQTSATINKLGRGLSAWPSEPYSSAPSDFFERGGRAENPLLWLVRAGIENDFEGVVFPEYPKLSEGKRALERAGAKYASLSGSGSALYGLFRSRAEAAKAAARLRREGWMARATVTLTRAQYWRRMVAA
jgi:4-diphosphocytidyl-2-C-methyl-D-erythritol kinase